MKELILEYLQEGIEVNFRFDSPICKMVMIKIFNGHKFQNTKVFSIDQFADEFTVPNAMERCRFELEEVVHSHMNMHPDEGEHHDVNEELPEPIKWKCVMCGHGGCPLGECLFDKK